MDFRYYFTTCMTRLQQSYVASKLEPTLNVTLLKRIFGQTHKGYRTHLTKLTPYERIQLSSWERLQKGLGCRFFM